MSLACHQRLDFAALRHLLPNQDNEKWRCQRRHSREGVAMDEPRSELIYHVSLRSDDLSKTCKLGCKDDTALTFLLTDGIDVHVHHYKNLHEFKIVSDDERSVDGKLVRFVELDK
jgi:hypothetical protein